MENYLNAVSSDIKNSFAGVEQMLRKMENGYEMHFMKIQQGGEMKGLVFFNMDHTQQTEFRAYIRHVSVLDKDDFSPAISAIVEFIWNELNADTIRIDLYHYKDGDETVPKANVMIKDALSMKRQGFKWKTLINDPETGHRYQIMQMNKPKDKEFNNKACELRKLKPKQEPVLIKAGLLLRLFKENHDAIPNKTVTR